MRVLVVGSGIAGATAALEAARLGHAVTVVTKAALPESASRYAQGGIAAVMDPRDSVAAHVADTLQAAAGLAEQEAVKVLCAEGPARVAELQRLGVRFDSAVDGRGPALGREGGHSARRILHAGGDSTGRAVVASLVAALEAGPVTVLEHTTLVDLLRDPLSGRVRGAELHGASGRVLVEADTVVLATGGAGQLYAHTTNPAIATGDGIAAAARAGVELRDLEFVQFHPTALAVPGTPLISEAVRGEGAVLLDERGRRFMVTEHPSAELAPRDVVARGIARAMAEQDGRPVMLDATGVPDLARRFPTVTATVRSAGLDWTREPVPVTPAAHYFMGGIRTDLHGRTSAPGLFAVGECASTGVHGANRLASNSLLEGLVFGHRVAHALADGAPDARPAADSHVGPRGFPVGSSRPLHDAEAATLRARVHHLMWDRVGLFRDGVGLRSAVDDLTELAWSTSVLPHPGDDTGALESRNLLLLAGLVARAALSRRDSVGAHHRLDAESLLTSGSGESGRALPDTRRKA